jgi:hypothetical protein
VRFATAFLSPNQRLCLAVARRLSPQARSSHCYLRHPLRGYGGAVGRKPQAHPRPALAPQRRACGCFAGRFASPAPVRAVFPDGVRAFGAPGGLARPPSPACCPRSASGAGQPPCTLPPPQPRGSRRTHQRHATDNGLPKNRHLTRQRPAVTFPNRRKRRQDKTQLSRRT